METDVARVHGLSHWGYIILITVRDSPGMNQLELAKAIGHDKNRIARDLDALEGAGLLGRTADPNDRRANRLHLTTDGLHRALAAQAELHQREDQMMADLTTEHRAAFTQTLRTLAARTRAIPDD
ncbi:MAG: MarR family transcriptional regulator [Hamadaea sp.]|uniref:MarR family winged helix-turn-helix transcriptional regulator n=1 Tax=Hamadaea sp. TaxID=2024425 RepID=UPI001839263E|nr:MarR family transcriptional regulator [Hamadaea sp.]NUR69969.1 MarR family transcriptional regulator [Hamadaea sp.]NUT20649.1 MarR family transcriptional regulator [Hamadaea sp.]